MLEFAYKYLENVIYYREELYTALGETIIMVFIAGIISTLIGIILGIALAWRLRPVSVRPSATKRT